MRTGKGRRAAGNRLQARTVFPKLMPEDRQERWSLTLLVTGIVVAIILATLLVTVAIMLVLIRTGVLPGDTLVWDDGIAPVLIVAGSCVIVGFGLTLLLIRIPLTPVNRVINAFNRLASGDYTVRISFGKPFCDHPTMVELSTSFNAMAEALGRTEVLQSDFVNNFSHEFKAPIASIAGFAELLKNPSLTEERRQEYLDIIREESLRLSHMATNVLNLNKVESQTILTDVTRFNLSEQVRGCVLLLEGKLEEKSLDLDLDFDEELLEANEDLLKQVWINLLDNAVKFSPAGGRISVSIRRDDAAGTLTVCVGNLGPAIPPEAKEDIFRKFYQLDSSKTAPGNGIGLAIVRQVVRLHRGSVRVDCRDGVTSFYVVLPVGQGG